MQKQSSFFSKQNLFHGGQLSVGRRKIARVLCSKRALHLVLKTSISNLREHKKLVEKATDRYSRSYGIKIYQQSIQRDHIHYILRVHDRDSYIKFIRALTSLLARHIGRGLWKYIPFTRVVSWGRAFEKVKAYVIMNEREILGLHPYRQRKQLYAKYLAGV